MRPIKFPESNSTLLGGPPKKYGADVGDLAVYRNGKQIISAWKPTFRERLSILFFGRVWLGVLASTTHAPVRLDGARTVFRATPEEEE